MRQLAGFRYSSVRNQIIWLRTLQISVYIDCLFSIFIETQLKYPHLASQRRISSQLTNYLREKTNSFAELTNSGMY